MGMTWNNPANATNSTITHSKSTLEWEINLGFNILIAFVIVTGNVLVLLLLHRSKVKVKTPFEVFVGNLSVADLLLEIGFLTANYVKTDSLLFCKAISPIMSICIVVSMYTVVAIAVFRYKTTTKPLHFRPGKKTIYGTIALIWLLSHVVFIPLYLVFVNKADKNGRVVCIEEWPLPIMNKVFTVALAVIQYLVPVSIIAFCYITIVFYLRKRTFPNDSSSNQLQFVKRRKQTMKIIRISVAILVLYSITTLPLQIAWLCNVVFQEQSIGEVVFLFSDQLVQLHCCCNPIVYGVVSKQFRSKMKNYICNFFCCSKKVYSIKKPRRILNREGVELSEIRALERPNNERL